MTAAHIATELCNYDDFSTIKNDIKMTFIMQIGGNILKIFLFFLTVIFLGILPPVLLHICFNGYF